MHVFAEEAYRKARGGHCGGRRYEKCNGVGVGAQKLCHVECYGHGRVGCVYMTGHIKRCRHVATVDIENEA